MSFRVDGARFSPLSLRPSPAFRVIVSGDEAVPRNQIFQFHVRVVWKLWIQIFPGPRSINRLNSHGRGKNSTPESCLLIYTRCVQQLLRDAANAIALYRSNSRDRGVLIPSYRHSYPKIPL